MGIMVLIAALNIASIIQTFLIYQPLATKWDQVSIGNVW